MQTTSNKGKHNYTYIVLFDLYKKYRYKTRNPYKPAGFYFFPKEEISKHEYALEFREWKVIVKTFMKNLLEHLKTGNHYKLPHAMGYWQMVKTKRPRRIKNYKKGQQLIQEGKMNVGEFIVEKKYFFNGYYPKLIWHKHGAIDTHFTNMSKVKINMIASVWKQYWKELKNPDTAHIIYNLNDY